MDWLFTYADPTIDWGYAVLTMLVRFVGVFVVLGIIQVSMQVTAKFVGRWERRNGDDEAVPVAKPAPRLAKPAPAAGLDAASVAAIAVALELEARPAAPRPIPAAAGSGLSGWAIEGRLRQLHRSPR